jgi:hypothetical protein
MGKLWYRWEVGGELKAAVKDPGRQWMMKECGRKSTRCCDDMARGGRQTAQNLASDAESDRGRVNKWQRLGTRDIHYTHCSWKHQNWIPRLLRVGSGGVIPAGIRPCLSVGKERRNVVGVEANWSQLEPDKHFSPRNGCHIVVLLLRSCAAPKGSSLQSVIPGKTKA